jgi:glycerol-3-phosphate dehydrogenase
VTHPRSRTRSAKLGPTERADAITRLRSEELDILIVGGGIVGAGSALDAVTRGLTTGLVEARDWGSGTSSRSSKLVHGGIRYLEQFNFALVREALIERGLLLQRIAPHLVKPIRFLYPLTQPIVERLYVGLGMLLYDIFSRTGQHPPGVPHHRHLSRRQLERAMPGLKRGKYRGGISYWDAQVDDARYVSTLVRTAAGFGAAVASRVTVVGLLKEGKRVVGVTAEDSISGEQFDIRAKTVVNATGVWTDEIQALLGEPGSFAVRASKGIHIVVPRERIHAVMGLLLATEKSVLFVIPWGKHWLIGTTDTPWDLNKAHPAATAADIDYLLEHVNSALSTPITRDDIEGVFAGLRPLLAGEAEETSKLSREHVVRHAAPGLVVVAGGKWTTYRVMAKDAIDAARENLGFRIPNSVTKSITLLGADGYQALWNNRKALAQETGLSQTQIANMLNRYGSQIDELLELIAQRPELARPLPGAESYSEAEVVYATTHEGALHVDDVLVRRLRSSIESWDSGRAAAPVVAALMAQELGWNAATTAAELNGYLQRIDAERASQQEFTDYDADRVRLGETKSASAVAAHAPRGLRAHD